MTERQTQTRQKILDAASSVFADEGFAGARVDVIAHRAGVNKAMLYYHVGNKQALYTAVLSRNFDRIEEELNRTLDMGGAAREQLEALITGMARTLESLPDHPRIMLREFASGGMYLQPEIFERMASLLGTVRGLLTDGVRNGEFRATDTVMTHLVLVGASLFLSAVAPLRKQVSKIDSGIEFPHGADLGEFVADLLLHGIAID